MKPEEPSNGCPGTETQPQEPSTGDPGSGDPGTPQQVPPVSERSHVSPKKRGANRRNSRKSTGPRSPEGKRKAARNATKHGFFSKHVVVHGDESLAEYQHLYDGIHQHYRPIGILEELLVEKIVVLCWQHRRVIRYQTGLVALALAEHSSDVASRPGLNELEIQESSPQVDSLRDHLLLPSKEEADKILRYEAMFMRQLDHATAELERLQSQGKAQDLQNEANKPFEMNAPECGCIQE